MLCSAPCLALVLRSLTRESLQKQRFVCHLIFIRRTTWTKSLETCILLFFLAPSLLLCLFWVIFEKNIAWWWLMQVYLLASLASCSSWLVNNTVWHITCQHMFGFFNVTFKKIKDVSSTTPDKYPTIFTVCCFFFRYERVNVQTVKSEMTTREQNTHHL